MYRAHSTRRAKMTTQTAVQQQQDLRSLSELYLTSCRIEGKSDETVRSYRETLDVFLRAVRHEGLPQAPWPFAAAHVYQFLGHVANSGVWQNKLGGSGHGRDL